ncbi:MAG: SufE family protein [Candidatus Bostrichicola ureolyticus]|nr:MAG: SufE family protein [Candidatus Bostrichicola ureolyticus]
MTLQKIEIEIIKEFEQLNNWEQKYEHLIELGKQLPKMSNQYKNVNTLIKNCQSKVWINAQLFNNIIIYKADSDALIPKGIAALMLRLYSGRHPKEIINSNNFIFSKIGFDTFLSTIRANGMLAMYKTIKLYAIAFNIKLNNISTKV